MYELLKMHRLCKQLFVLEIFSFQILIAAMMSPIRSTCILDYHDDEMNAMSILI
jgi:hypothetical protein